MPFILKNTDCAPLAVDYEFEIADEDLLASYVGELLLGNHYYVKNIIDSLSTEMPESPDQSIDAILRELANANPPEKRDGWLFQMISWLVLGVRHTGQSYYTQQPHGAPAHHGLDGMGIVLKPDRTLDKIIICEDKFAQNPRNKIQQQVWPEFKKIEAGEKDHVLVATISMILGQMDAGSVLASVRNNIYDTVYRVYRVGANRLAAHNSDEGRKGLFLGYDEKVPGDLRRRTGATIYFPDHSSWMDSFYAKVVAYLNSKKSNVQPDN
jgi:hypothetical protein